MMFRRKIPKRNISVPRGELWDIFSLFRVSSLIKGRHVEEFEHKFRDFVSSKEAIAVSSGRFAMSLILRNLGLNKGDSVILSAYNYKGVPKALIKEGFNPIFVDVDKNTYQIDINKIEEKIDSTTKAIIVTHLFGQLADLDRIVDIAKRYNLFIVEDAAHSLGSYYKGRHAGSIGDAGFFSFTGSKTINTSFGGIVITNNADLASRIRSKIINCRYPRKMSLIKSRITTHFHAFLTSKLIYGFVIYPMTVLMNMFNLDPLELYKSMKKKEMTDKKMKFTNLQALIGLKQISNLENILSTKRVMTEKILNGLASSISIQASCPDSLSNYFMMPLKAKGKIVAFKKLLLEGIDSNLDYVSYCSGIRDSKDTPVAKALSNTMLTVSLPYNLSEKESSQVISSINKRRDFLD